MRIAVIGTGNVGSVLGRRWSENGHEVVFGSRSPESNRVTAVLSDTGATATDPATAVRDAEVVVLATPWGPTESIIAGFGDLSGKILIDCTNPLRDDLSLDPSVKPSGGEKVAEWAKGAHVVKAFCTTGSANMENPVFGSNRLAMLICGDDPDAKNIVAGLANELGFEPVDNGPLSQSHYLEAFAVIWIKQAYVQGWGPGFGFVVVKR